MAPSEKGEALKTTAAIGGGQIFIIISGIVRTKVAALVLGPSGVGLIGILAVASEMIRNITSLGLPLSGVREISMAVSSNDNEKLQKTSGIFLKWILFTAFLGALLSAIIGFPLSKYLFGNYNYGWSFIILGISVFFSSLTTGKNAILQGRRVIPLMIRANVLGNLTATILVSLVYVIFGEKGIVAGIVIGSVVIFLFTSYFYNKLDNKPTEKINLIKSYPYAKEMIKIGMFTIFVAVFDQIVNLGLRTFITEKHGINGVGYFTAASTVAGMYLTVILGSLGSDYLPKLAALNANEDINNAVNLQLNIVLLLASPIIIAMTGFSDLALQILYSKEFLGANEILQWQIIGDFFKIISWPCGFVFLAKGHGRAYTIYSITYTIVNVLLIVLLWKYLGFSVIGIAFFITQLLALIATYVIFYKMYKIKISRDNIRIITLMGFCIFVSYLFHNYIQTLFLSRILSAFITICAGLYAFNCLQKETNIIQNLVQRFRK